MFKEKPDEIRSIPPAVFFEKFYKRFYNNFREIPRKPSTIEYILKAHNC